MDIFKGPIRVSQYVQQRGADVLVSLESVNIWEGVRHSLVTLFPIGKHSDLPSSSELSPLGLLYSVRFIYDFMSTSPKRADEIFGDEELMRVLIAILSHQCLSSMASWFVCVSRSFGGFPSEYSSCLLPITLFSLSCASVLHLDGVLDNAVGCQWE